MASIGTMDSIALIMGQDYTIIMASFLQGISQGLAYTNSGVPV